MKIQSRFLGFRPFVLVERTEEGDYDVELGGCESDEERFAVIRQMSAGARALKKALKARIKAERE